MNGPANLAASVAARLLNALLTLVLVDLRGGHAKAGTWTPGGPWFAA